MIKKQISCKDDLKTHLYTLIINPDNTYTVLIDNEKAESGNIEDDWDMLPPKKIDVSSVVFQIMVVGSQCQKTQRLGRRRDDG